VNAPVGQPMEAELKGNGVEENHCLFYPETNHGFHTIPLPGTMKLGQSGKFIFGKGPLNSFNEKA